MKSIDVYTFSTKSFARQKFEGMNIQLTMLLLKKFEFQSTSVWLEKIQNSNIH